MKKMNSKRGKAVFGGIAAAVLSAVVFGQAAYAQQSTIRGEEYTPTIWVDPDGCTHWVMDDGAEGYMSPRRNRDGSPICMRSEICGVIPTDQLFATDRANINADNRQRLQQFFQQAQAFGFLIYGHTDSRASDEYNIRLSQRRANAVADVANSVGARVVDIKGFGERMPRAAGSDAASLQQNRRVEIYCIR